MNDPADTAVPDRNDWTLLYEGGKGSLVPSGGFQDHLPNYRVYASSFHESIDTAGRVDPVDFSGTGLPAVNQNGVPTGSVDPAPGVPYFYGDAARV